jgi:hypothetical protein
MKKSFRCLMLQLFCAMNINAQVIMPQELVINEILFNPVKDGYDYVEVYNRSKIAINVNELLVANRNAEDRIASLKNVSKESLIIAPGGYFVITPSAHWLKQHYSIPDPVIIVQVPSLPSLPDNEGCVSLLRKSDSMIIDELAYDEKWHIKLIADPEGIALERINYDAGTQDKNNWTSASSSSGFGTPGYINSQFRRSQNKNAAISVQPEIFSPNNDGQNDFALINIKTEEQGKVANAVVFNAEGRRVRYLLKNEVLGMSNNFTWDGYGDNDQLLPSGIYIIFTQVFDGKGAVNKYRNCIVLNSFPP